MPTMIINDTPINVAATPLLITQQVEDTASTKPSDKEKENPTKDVNLGVSLPRSHGSSLSKAAKEKHASLERTEQEVHSYIFDFDSQNSEDTTGFGFDFEDLSLKLMEDPLGIVDNYLTKVSTSSQSQISAPEATTSETSNSVAVEILKELHSVALNIIELLRQGQDPSLRLQSIQSKLNTHKELFPTKKLVEMERVIQFLSDLSINYKRIESVQGLKSGLKTKFDARMKRIRDVGTKAAQEKEKNRKDAASLAEIDSHIQKLENELRESKARRKIMQTENSKQASELKSIIEILAQEMKLGAEDKKKLTKVEGEVIKAMINFEEQKKKYQLLRDAALFNSLYK